MRCKMLYYIILLCQVPNILNSLSQSSRQICKSLSWAPVFEFGVFSEYYAFYVVIYKKYSVWKIKMSYLDELPYRVSINFIKET